MSAPEIAHRFVRAVRHPIDRVRMASGRYVPRRPDLDVWEGPSPFYIEPAGAAAVAGPALLAAAEGICRGEREVLGLGWLTVGDAPWHLEPLAGREWPRIDSTLVRTRSPASFDPRLTWEFNRGHEWVILALASAATGDERFRRRLDAELASWRRDNPLGVGINWVSAMEAAIRIHSLVWVAGLLRGSPFATVAQLIHEHAWFVERNLSAFSSANNHLIVELTSLMVAARAIGGPWGNRARARLERELERQVSPDGVDLEMATHYHVFVLEAVSLAAWLERAHGNPSDRIERVVAAMAAYAEALICSDGQLLQQGDSDDGKILPFLRDPRRLLSITAAIGDLDQAAFARVATPRQTGSHVFRDAGQVVLRGSRLLATFDAGSFGFGSLAAHAHCDALAVNVALAGQPLLVDRGTYRYNGDPEARGRYRMTAAHNTLQVDGQEQAIAAGPFLWRKTPAVTLERCELSGAIELVQARHDGFRGGPHRRTIVHCEGALIIVDEILGSATTGTVRFHFAPGLDLTAQSDRAFVATRGSTVGGRLFIGNAGTISQTAHSDRYAAETSATTVATTTRGGCAVAVITSTEDPRPLVRPVLAALADHVQRAALDQLGALAR